MGRGDACPFGAAERLCLHPPLQEPRDSRIAGTELWKRFGFQPAQRIYSGLG